LQCSERTGSIHKVSAELLKKENNSGWSLGYFKRNGKFLSIEELRYHFEKEYLTPPKRMPKTHTFKAKCLTTEVE
jgi:hypothetical protein